MPYAKRHRRKKERERGRRRREEGLCHECSSKAAPGLTYCRPCLDERKENYVSESDAIRRGTNDTPFGERGHEGH